MRCFVTSQPTTDAWPPVGGNSVVRILMIVLLPAPLGPSNPKTSPLLTEKLTRSTAIFSPKRFTRSTTSIMGDDCSITLLLPSLDLNHHDGEWLPGALQEALKQLLQCLLLILLKSSEPLYNNLPASLVPCFHLFVALGGKHHAHHALIVALALACHQPGFFPWFASSCNGTAGDAKRFGQFANAERVFSAQEPQ